MASTNRFALLDDTQLKTLIKLRGLSEQDTAEDMITALHEQSAADRAEEAEWLAEKAAQDVASSTAATSSPYTPLRTVSWADDAQEEADAMAEAAAKAEADVGSGSELEAGWETVVRRSPRQKKVDEAAGGSRGGESAEDVDVKAVLPLTLTKLESEGEMVGQTEGLQSTPDSPEVNGAAASPPSAIDSTLADEILEAVNGFPSAGITDENVTPSEPTFGAVEQVEDAPEPFPQEEVAAGMPTTNVETAGDHAESPFTKPDAMSCASYPEWDDYIASMPAVFATSRRTTEPVSSASSPVFKATKFRELQTVTSGPAKDTDAAGSPYTPARHSSPSADPVVESKMTTTFTQVSSPPAAYPTLASTPLSEETQDRTAIETLDNSPIDFDSTHTLINLSNDASADLDKIAKGAAPILEQEVKSEAELTPEAVSNTGVEDGVHSFVEVEPEIAPDDNEIALREPAVTHIKKPPTKDQHGAAEEAASTANVSSTDLVLPQEGLDAFGGKYQPEAAHAVQDMTFRGTRGVWTQGMLTQKNKLRRRERRKKAKQHDVVAATKSKKGKSTDLGSKDRRSIEVPVKAPKKKKLSGAQRRREAAAAARAASTRPLGVQLGSYYMPWFVALTIVMAQLLVIVVVIHLFM